MARDARARLERIAAKLAPHQSAVGSLSALERRELDRLEADYRARFPDDVDRWSEREIDDFLFTYANGRDGTAQRLDELRHRALSPAERAELRANQLAIESMNVDELDLWMTEMTLAAQAESEP